MENREGIRHAAGSVSELVVCTTVLGTSFAAVVKKEILEEGQEGKRNAVTLGPAHHEVAVGALWGQGRDQGLDRRQHEANGVLVRGRAIGFRGHCQGQGHQWEGGREGQAGGYTLRRERRVHSDEYKISTFLSSPDVAHTSVLAAQGSCEAVRSCGAVLDRRGKLL